MKQLNFHTGGEGFKIDDLLWMQNGVIEALNSLCSGLGTGLSSNASVHNAFVLSGCQITGVSGAYTISAGFIYYNGEIFVVPAHTSSATTPYWTIVGTSPLPTGVTTPPTIDQYEDPSVTFYTDVLREMQMTNSGAVLVTNCPNIRSIIGVVPSQGIIMYSGSTSNFDGTGLGNIGSAVEGYALCNGNITNGTPDLQGKFIVGYNPSETDYNAIGKTGGEKTHTLIDSEIPAHLHNLIDPGHAHQFTINPGGQTVASTPTTSNASTDTNAYTATASTNISLNHGTPDGGGNGAHENRPPYYTLCYIMKI